MFIKTILDCRVEHDQVEYLILSRRESDDDQDKENEAIWVKEHTINLPLLIDEYLDRVTQGRRVDFIVGAAPTKDNVWFYIKWSGNKVNGAWLPSHVIKKKYPQDLIKFYEKNLFMT